MAEDNNSQKDQLEENTDIGSSIPDEVTPSPIDIEKGQEDNTEPEKSTEEKPDDVVEEKEKETFDTEHIEEFVSKKVHSIVFGVLSPKMIRKMAVCKVVTPELYDKEGYPVDGGLMDVRMGVIDPGLVCRTDGRKLKECPGYFGYIELARPIIHINFVNLVLTLLKCTCKECGRVLIPKNKIEKIMKDLDDVEKDQGLEGRRKMIKGVVTSLKTQNKCPYCKAKQAKITIEKPTTFLENEKRISPIEIRTRLEKIPNEDCPVFGINPEAMRPDWAILTIFPIPPVTVRPSITLESGERSEDDLTHKLGDIVRINQRLFENINAGAPEIIIEDLWDLLQYHITTYFDNNVAQLPPARHRSGQPLKTIAERIRSKEGRIRHNLAGKRTNFSARTVISPDPMLSINEVGVPMEIAMNITVPERVTEWNMEYLKKFIERGNDKYPGANYVIRPDGKKKKITHETKEQSLEEIQPGYIVERHLMDGDISIFNRQPSLHRMSMMCHKVRVLPGKTLRLNPAVCTPYNADFDGDEMNLHIPQTEEARAEAEVLMQVQTQLISPRYGLSVIGCTLDAISGNYLLTKDMVLSRKEAIELLFTIGVEDITKLPNKEKITGKEIFSVLLPDDFNYKGTSRLAAKDENGKLNPDHIVKIENGNIISGIMDKNNLGDGKGLLLRTLHKKYGAEKTVEVLGNIFRLGIEILLKTGFSVSIADSDMPPKAREMINNVLNTAYENVTKLINEYKEGNLDTFPGRSVEETLELKIMEILNKARNETGNIVQENTNPKAHTKIMADSGAKGNFLNLAQMAACVGQQAMRGKRIEKGYKGRTLSHFRQGDLSPAAHGFIKDGFKGGLNPSEFFFMAITGRDSLMDTALRTPRSGYLYRRLANAMQDLRVEYDNTVRDAAGKIIQFLYGEDGMDVTKSEGGVLNVDNIIQNTK